MRPALFQFRNRALEFDRISQRIPDDLRSDRIHSRALGAAYQRNARRTVMQWPQRLQRRLLCAFNPSRVERVTDCDFLERDVFAAQGGRYFLDVLVQRRNHEMGVEIDRGNVGMAMQYIDLTMQF